MKFRTFLATICLTALPVLAQDADKPNILLIIADDMGLDPSTCYAVGHQQAKMPNIQAMCDSGLVFDNAYSAPFCTPTRAPIMTGQYSFRTGTGGAIPRDGTNGLSPDVTSLFDVLAQTDYSANLIGKWHLAGSDAGANHPAELGVPNYWGLYKGGANPSYWEWTGMDNGTPIDVTEYATTAFADRAIDWIGAQDADKPWFLWLAYNAPHTPFHLPPAHLHTAGDLPTDEDSIKADQLTYYNAMLEALDTEIGRLLSTLDDDTIVMFIGDNGSPNQVTDDFYGEHGAKGTIYEGGTHVPFVMTGPAIEAGRTDALVQTPDLFTTIAGTAGAEVPTTDGSDFAPVLSRGTTTRDNIYVEQFSEYEPKPSDVFGWAVREGDHKLVAVEGAEPVLYDPAADPIEATDLLADGISEGQAAILSRL